METPEYIKNIEKDGEMFSVLKLQALPTDFDKIVDGLKTTIVYSEGKVDYKDGVFTFNEKIYKTTQGFYLYLSLRLFGTPELIIYYKQQQLNEMTLFVKGLLKQFKNATVNI
jgi:hypothetical protein